MYSENEPLRPEDYIEPRCVLCDEPYGVQAAVKPIPQQRIIAKMDEYMSHRDYAGAERHLCYWLEEAKLGGDLRGELFVHGELIGHYRKTGDRQNALEHIGEALSLIKKLEFEKTISAGTTYINAATALSAFGENEKALPLFESAREIYESAPKTSPDLLGGLYNNMALCCAALSRFEDCMSLYQKALDTMRTVPGGELERAITYLNMANAKEAQLGLEAAESFIFDYLDKAADLLDETDAPRDGYYAFVCEKCAPTFSYYGYFAEAKDLQGRAEEIYGRNNERT